MADVTFINFFATLDEALNERSSPETYFYEVRGIQLLPNNPEYYRQSTNTANGIEIEDWTAKLVQVSTGLEYDITDNFEIERTFVDENSNAQFDWTLTDVPFDLGSSLVYIKLTQLAAESYYSNMFLITENNSEKTVRVDYGGVDSVNYKSIQLQMWFWQEIKSMETTVYYERSTKLTRTNTIKSQKAEKWVTAIISNSLWIKITDMMENRDIYFDKVRCNLFESPEVKEHEGQRNSERNILKISFDKSDVLEII